MIRGDSDRPGSEPCRYSVFGRELAEALRSAAVASLAAIAVEPPAADDYSLASGFAGLALLHHAASRAGVGLQPALASAYLDRALDALADGTPGEGLCSGIAGVAFAVHRVLDPADAAEATADADALLLDVLERGGPFDVVEGIAGIGLYGLSAGARGAALAERAVTVLAARAEGGSTWRTPRTLVLGSGAAQYPEGRYDLGLAHGIPGVIGFLAAACAAGHGGAGARGLLARSVEGLLAERAADGSFGCYRAAGAARGSAAGPSRTAWCYGDAGVAFVVWRAARVLGDASLEDAAVALARRACGRSAQEAGVVDAGLCHGAAGLLHLSLRFFAATRDECFARAARAWAEVTLASSTAGPGLLEGAAGVALVIVDALSPGRTGWDSALLLDLPEPR